MDRAYYEVVTTFFSILLWLSLSPMAHRPFVPIGTHPCQYCVAHPPPPPHGGGGTGQH